MGSFATVHNASIGWRTLPIRLCQRAFHLDTSPPGIYHLRSRGTYDLIPSVTGQTLGGDRRVGTVVENPLVVQQALAQAPAPQHRGARAAAVRSELREGVQQTT